MSHAERTPQTEGRSDQPASEEGGGGGGVTDLMVSLFAEIVTFSFWPKTMDYSKAFRSDSLEAHNSSLEGATELKFAPFCSLRH